MFRFAPNALVLPRNARNVWFRQEREGTSTEPVECLVWTRTRGHFLGTAECCSEWHFGRDRLAFLANVGTQPEREDTSTGSAECFVLA